MKIKNNTLVCKPVENTVLFSSSLHQSPVNRLLIIDESGSMWDEIDKVTEDISTELNNFNPSDFISIGYFSGMNQYGWICKGVSAEHKDKIRQMLRNHRHAMGMTMFSQILEDTKAVVSDLSVLSTRFSLLFYSDGEPTVGNKHTEINKVISTLNELKLSVEYSMFIGYGEYYNRDILNNMAQTVGGVLVHSSNLQQLRKYFTQFSSADSAPKKEVIIEDSPVRNFVYSINGKNINAYLIENGKVHVPQDVDRIYYLSPKSNLESNFSEENLLPAVYAGAKLYSQSGDVSTALDMLGAIGDINFIDGLNNSFTNAEYGKVEEMLSFAVANEQYRFVEGRNLNYLPKDDEFCVLDLLELLQITESKFLPFHEEFVYRKISKPTKTKDGYPKLIVDKSQEISFNQFTWNSSKLNLSVLGKIYGTVDLGEESVKYGIAQTYPTYNYRNYSIIVDGKVNTPKLPVRLSESALTKLYERNLIKSNDLEQILDLSLLPVINRKIASQYTSAAMLAEKVYRETELEAYQKYLKYQITQLEEDTSIHSELLTEEQLKFLESRGITKNGYAPPKESIESTDIYFTKTFEVIVDKIKSIPKIEDFLKKYYGKGVDSSKPVEIILSEIHEEFQNKTVEMKEGATVLWLQNKLNEVKSELWSLRQYINKAKFAVILAKQSFQEIQKLEEVTPFSHNGIDFTFKMRSDVEVKI